ncbi:D-sedoheptulose-7-phosphate isomerase [Agromyces aerolatus]|uniref:D-sedoheptulose-7-phosphate isomerase n=1 Tax=Agromyces sp. LY-1074 TaxID=3074080 RepID=UPI0028644D7D|nr:MULTISPECIES: SIS domain-containing protein [unclassified Agromyces]MDR5700586.1 SIS domain-containing protein [Agromyces sp. LY-1074]MDR5707107.1 SIS domain-containing protein [Agromyces sp. LY-1358]
MTIPHTAPATTAYRLARSITAHTRGLRPVLDALELEAPRLAAWAVHLAARLGDGHRLLVAGNGGSAAEAQHLAAEFTGRFREERRPFAALALNTDSSAVTAIGNDYGFEQVFARQVLAHARPGDVLLLLSTSGASANLLAAADAARRAGATRWAITGPAPNPLATVCDDVIALHGTAANVQEAELVAVHALCLAFDAAIGGAIDAAIAAPPTGAVR